MYVSKSSLSLATSASPIPGNLALRESQDDDVLSDTLAVFHDSYVNVIPITSTTRRSKYVPIFKGDQQKQQQHDEKGTIKQVRWVELAGKYYFVALSTNGLHIYDDEASNLVYRHACRETGDENSYNIGICTLKGDVLCVGTHLGTVWIFKVVGDDDFKVVNRVYAHDEAVTLLEGYGNFMASSSEFITYLWSFNDRAFDIIRKIDVHGLHSTPSALRFKFGLIVLGYASGEFCIFDLNDESFCLRTVAHKLKITALDFAATFKIVTVSNDCYIKLFKYEQLAQNVR
ncbi:PREDICTED: WD repeat-containing protein 54-like [Nicrophorus vespilloides]|uniref:WD repeat-containing protein 54-like n=1 Tax=Nicrophorus vespilloides TaxID=110193 RepID=A0ABM1MAJ1_NICVS|nr:PREDICTED: WD repeat-containing protein 54-like [Nicrophorus vespilloides]